MRVALWSSIKVEYYKSISFNYIPQLGGVSHAALLLLRALIYLISRIFGFPLKCFYHIHIITIYNLKCIYVACITILVGGIDFICIHFPTVCDLKTKRASLNQIHKHKNNNTNSFRDVAPKKHYNTNWCSDLVS